MSDWSHDTILNGSLDIAQPKNGYRFSLDALILAHHVIAAADDRIVDIGTGCGVIPLLLARQNPEIKVLGIEVQTALARLAKSNAASNHLSERIRIIEKDIRTVSATDTGPVHIITCNPPHTARTAGRINPNHQMAVAKHEIKMSLGTLIEAANRLLTHKGRVFTIYPANRMIEVLLKMRETGLEPKRIRTIHFKSDTSASRILIQASKGGQPGTEIVPPLVIHNPDGSYTPEAIAVMTPGGRGHKGNRAP